MLWALLPLALPCAAPDSADTLRVLVWNIERGSNPYARGPEKALAVLREAKPDVCLLQESYDVDGERPELGAWLARQLDEEGSERRWTWWQAESPHLAVVTHLDVEERWMHAPWHGVGARLRDDAGRELLTYSIWIDWRAYLPYALRDDPSITDEALLACESEGSSRLPQATALFDYVREAGHTSGDLPLLVGGDWNSPSHLDWTEDTARVFRFKRALPLPVSLLADERGLVDTFREVHPDPLRVPGFTWTPLERGAVDAPMPQDRIDRLYRLPSSGEWDLVPVAAHVLPRVHESMSIERAERRFPSDHGAVVVDFEWRRRE